MHPPSEIDPAFLAAWRESQGQPIDALPRPKGNAVSKTDELLPSGYSPDIITDAEKNPTLGAEYFAAREAAERFLSHWQEEHAEKLAEEIMKPVLDAVKDRVWDAFRDWLLIDTEYNIHGAMTRMVEDSVKALIGGDKWANVKYISPEGYRTEKVRETLAKLYSDEIKDGRIADLEKEVARLEESLRFARRDY